MPLIDRNRMPPGGFYYREPALNWVTPNPFLPFDMIAAEIQSIRISNLGAGLNPDLDSCKESLDLFTCTRLKNASQWCVSADTTVARTIEENRKKKIGCASCGKRKNK